MKAAPISACSNCSSRSVKSPPNPRDRAGDCATTTAWKATSRRQKPCPGFRAATPISTASFLLENSAASSPSVHFRSLLPRLLGGPVTLHEESGRLFIGNIATHFTASLSADNPPRLVFRFTAPVNPTIATEPGSLRMTFSREPLVAPASPTSLSATSRFPPRIYSEAMAWRWSPSIHDSR